MKPVGSALPKRFKPDTWLRLFFQILLVLLGVACVDSHRSPTAFFYLAVLGCSGTLLINKQQRIEAIGFLRHWRKTWPLLCCALVVAFAGVSFFSYLPWWSEKTPRQLTAISMGFTGLVLFLPHSRRIRAGLAYHLGAFAGCFFLLFRMVKEYTSYINGVYTETAYTYMLVNTGRSVADLSFLFFPMFANKKYHYYAVPGLVFLFALSCILPVSVNAFILLTFAGTYSFVRLFPRAATFFCAMVFIGSGLFLLAIVLAHAHMPEASFWDMLPASYVHRLYIWEYALAFIEGKPFFGYGAGYSGVASALSPLYPHDETARLFGVHTHNILLLVTLESGLIGLLLFMAMCVALLKLVISTARDTIEKAAIAGILAALVPQMMVEIGFFRHYFLAIFYFSLYGFFLLRPARMPNIEAADG